MTSEQTAAGRQCRASAAVRVDEDVPGLDLHQLAVHAANDAVALVHGHVLHRLVVLGQLHVLQERCAGGGGVGVGGTSGKPRWAGAAGKAGLRKPLPSLSSDSHGSCCGCMPASVQAGGAAHLVQVALARGLDDGGADGHGAAAVAHGLVRGDQLLELLEALQAVRWRGVRAGAGPRWAGPVTQHRQTGACQLRKHTQLAMGGHPARDITQTWPNLPLAAACQHAPCTGPRSRRGASGRRWCWRRSGAWRWSPLREGGAAAGAGLRAYSAQGGANPHFLLLRRVSCSFCPF